MKNENLGFETKAIHIGSEPDEKTGAVTPPIFLSTTFQQDSPGQPKAGFEYIRAGSPTKTQYEKCLASLERAKHAFAFSSGCAATSMVLQTLKKGDHIISSDDLYGGTYRLFETVFKKFGLEFSFVDTTNINNVEEAIKRNTRLVWIETPTNPTLKISNIQQISQLIKNKDVVLAVDNTFLSPYFQSPLSLGAHIVVHSGTKYLGGHSDVLGGAVVTNNDQLAEEFVHLSKTVGSCPSPFDCYLLLRSLKTLSIRMKAHEENAMKVAKMLENSPLVDEVLYPGLKSHPQHELAKTQMKGFGGMVSFYLKGGWLEVEKFLKNLKVFVLAESLGGVESFVNHPAAMTHASLPQDMLNNLRIKENLLRLSVGLETPQDLIDDLEHSLKKV